MPKQQLTNPQLAKAIDKLKWHEIQSDSPSEGANFQFCFDDLMKRDKEKAIRILFAVIEAQNLPDDFMGEDRIMHEFEYL